MAAFLPFQAYDSSDNEEEEGAQQTRSLSAFDEETTEFDSTTDFATPIDLNAAYFSPASASLMVDQEPSVLGRTWLRKNETKYANVKPGDNTLAPYAIPPFCSDASKSFGTILEDREVVGEMKDKEGKAIGYVMAKLPPPPDKNYSHMNAPTAGRHHLSRLFGYDPEVFHNKTEVTDPTNLPDNLNGDAQYSSVRIEEVTERQERQLFTSGDHTQAFADFAGGSGGGGGRTRGGAGGGDALYDGYNNRLSAQQMGDAYLKKMMHSWRESQPQKAPPSNVTPVVAEQGQAGRGNATLRRKEVGKGFDVKPKAGGVSHVNLTALPIAATSLFRKEGEDRAGPAKGSVEAAEGAKREGPRGKVRKDSRMEEKTHRMVAEGKGGGGGGLGEGKRVDGVPTLNAEERRTHSRSKDHAGGSTTIDGGAGRRKVDGTATAKAEDRLATSRSKDEGGGSVSQHQGGRVKPSVKLEKDMSVPIHAEAMKTSLAALSGAERRRVDAEAVANGTDASDVTRERMEGGKGGGPTAGGRRVAEGVTRVPVDEEATWFEGLVNARGAVDRQFVRPGGGEETLNGTDASRLEGGEGMRSGGGGGGGQPSVRVRPEVSGGNALAGMQKIDRPIDGAPVSQMQVRWEADAEEVEGGEGRREGRRGGGGDEAERRMERMIEERRTRSASAPMNESRVPGRVTFNTTKVEVM